MCPRSSRPVAPQIAWLPANVGSAICLTVGDLNGSSGEAVKKLPLTFRKKYTKIEWSEIAGMRDILIHDYFGININVVWDTVKKDIPKLKKQINNLYENLI